jgi:hypothetical protein
LARQHRANRFQELNAAGLDHSYRVGTHTEEFPRPELKALSEGGRER